MICVFDSLLGTILVWTKYIKTCTELSHPGCLLLQFYALNHVLIIDCLTLVCFTDLHVHLLKSEFLQV